MPSARRTVSGDLAFGQQNRLPNEGETAVRPTVQYVVETFSPDVASVRAARFLLNNRPHPERLWDHVLERRVERHARLCRAPRLQRFLTPLHAEAGHPSISGKGVGRNASSDELPTACRVRHRITLISEAHRAGCPVRRHKCWPRRYRGDQSDSGAER